MAVVRDLSGANSTAIMSQGFSYNNKDQGYKTDSIYFLRNQIYVIILSFLSSIEDKCWLVDSLDETLIWFYPTHTDRVAATFQIEPDAKIRSNPVKNVQSVIHWYLMNCWEGRKNCLFAIFWCFLGHTYLYWCSDYISKQVNYQVNRFIHIYILDIHIQCAAFTLRHQFLHFFSNKSSSNSKPNDSYWTCSSWGFRNTP